MLVVGMLRDKHEIMENCTNWNAINDDRGTLGGSGEE